MKEADKPQSSLTVERPDIWYRGLALATSLTGYVYLPKIPLTEDPLSLCGYNYPRYYPPKKSETPENKEKREQKERREKIEQEIIDIERMIKQFEGSIDHANTNIDGWRKNIEQKKKELEEKRRELAEHDWIIKAAAPVPEGAMEWLLHEVGHWVAATPQERALPDYGLVPGKVGKGSREWQAWAFEDIVLAPFGPARSFAPPTQRDGVAFEKSGPIDARHLRHIDRRIVELGIDIERWRALYSEWVVWGSRRGPGRAPWEQLS